MSVGAAYVINMDGAKERMRFMASQCDSLGIPFVRVPAVNGSKVRPHVLGRLTPRCEKYCTDSMIGCALSHMNVWNMVLEQGQERALIMEDDAQLVPGFAEGLSRALRDVPEDFDVLLLGCFALCDKKRDYSWGHRMLKALMPLGGFSVRNDRRTWGSVYVPEFFAGAHCYVVSRKGCRRLLDLIPRVDQHIDICMNHPDLRLYAVSPDLAFQRDMSDSSIASFTFPKTLVPLLEPIKDKKRISLAYYLSAPVCKVWVLMINAWFVIFFALGLFQAWTLPYVAGLFLAELAVGGDITAPLVAYGLGWGLQGLRGPWWR